MIKKKLVALCVATALPVFSAEANPQPDQLIDIAITVQGAKVNGDMHLCIWNDKKGFPFCDDQAAYYHVTTSDNAVVAHVFRGIPMGTYAIGGYFDENQNGKLDRTLVGFPKEKMVMLTDEPIKGRPNFARLARKFETSVSLDLELRTPGRRGQ